MTECDVSSWTDIVDIAVGSGFIVGIKSDGTAVSTGKFEGQYAIDISEWKNLKAIYAKNGGIVGLHFDGTVSATGLGYNWSNNINKWTNITSVAMGVIS